jgi:hypothetical protein
MKEAEKEEEEWREEGKKEWREERIKGEEREERRKIGVRRKKKRQSRRKSKEGECARTFYKMQQHNATDSEVRISDIWSCYIG